MSRRRSNRQVPDEELLEDDVADDYEPAPQLNLQHGFIRSIIRNQIYRDEYHNAQRKMLDEYTTALKTGKQLSTNSPKRRERALYIAPARRLTDAKGTPESSTGCPIRDATRQRVAKEMQRRRAELAKTTEVKNTSTEPALDPKQPLFKLELLDIHGVVHSCVVYAGDSAARVAKMYCQKLELPTECAKELRQRIESQLEEHTQRASSIVPSSSSAVLTQSNSDEEMQFHDAPESPPPNNNRRRVIAKDALTGLRRIITNNIQQSRQRRVIADD